GGKESIIWRPDRSPTDMTATLTVAKPQDLLPHVGRELGPSEWMTVDQAMIDKFADATGDHQWIHVDVERARREMPGGKTIAHGYLTLSLIPRMAATLLEITRRGRGINYGSNKIRLISPVPAGSASACARGSSTPKRGPAPALRPASQHEAAVGLGVLDARALAVARRPALQQLVHPVSRPDLRDVRPERRALERERVADVDPGVWRDRAGEEDLFHVVGLE